MKLTRLAVGKRVATSVIAIALLVLGIYGLQRLPVDFLPKITYPMIKVHVWWRGATPEEIDRSLADPIERQMATVDGLDYLESSSIEGMYTLLVNFRYGTNVDVAYQDALAAMARVARELPKDVEPPIVIKADPSQLPVAQVTISSDRWDLVKLRDWTENWLQDRLLAVPGVAGTEIVGGQKREIRIHLDPLAMEKAGLSLSQVAQRLRDENIELSVGRVTRGSQELIARVLGEFHTLDQIRAVVLKREAGSRITVQEIGRVVDSHEEVRVITRLGGKPCVKLSVLKQSDANTLSVARAVNRQLDVLRREVPAGVRLGVVENQAQYIEEALNGVRDSALQAGVLVIVVVFLFLGSWRQVVIMLLALPLTLVLNFGLMQLAGFSINLFSLGGLVIAMGVILDNSIVVIENITRIRRVRQEESAPEKVDVASAGAAEVGSAVTAGTISFVVLFVPFLLVPGLSSLLFRELILVVAGIAAVSLLTALTFTPMLASVLLGRRAKVGKTTWFERIFESVAGGYAWLLRRVIRWRWIVLGLGLAVIAAAVVILPRVGSEFLPAMDDGRVMVKVKLPTGASLAQTNQLLERIQAKLADDPLIQSSFTLAGGKVWGLYTYEIANEGEVNIQLKPRDQRPLSTAKYVQRLRSRLKGVQEPGAKIMVKPMKVKGIRKIGEADIEVKLRGQDMSRLFRLSGEIVRKMRSLSALANVHMSLDYRKPELQITLDRTKAQELGVSAASLASTVQGLTSGTIASRYRDRGEYYPIRLVIPESEIRSRRDLENMVVTTDAGKQVRVRDVAAVSQAVGPVEIVRENQVKQVVVRADVRSGNVGGALEGLREDLAKLSLPAGYTLEYGGQAQMMSDMRRNLILVLAFAIFFAFVVLAVQFNNLKLPMLILGAVPLCLTGMLAALFVTGFPIGATVAIGVLVVVAATINDGVLLLTFAGEIQADRGSAPSEAVVEAGRIRLRPRVMTTLSTMAGLMPLAFNLGEGGDMLQPMAIGALGGLGFELLVALFFMPCLYVLFTREHR